MGHLGVYFPDYIRGTQQFDISLGGQVASSKYMSGLCIVILSYCQPPGKPTPGQVRDDLQSEADK